MPFIAQNTNYNLKDSIGEKRLKTHHPIISNINKINEIKSLDESEDFQALNIITDEVDIKKKRAFKRIEDFKYEKVDDVGAIKVDSESALRIGIVNYFLSRK